MTDSVEKLLHLLTLERIEVDLYRGEQPEVARQRMFGGQVLGQALSAAYDTVEPGRRLHSLHAYFILAGDTGIPVLYDVDRIRDGRSFTTRRTAAVQHGRPIFYLTASFQVEEDGPEHQDVAPDVPGDPTSFPRLHDYVNSLGRQTMMRIEDDFPAIDIRVAGVDPKAALGGSSYPSVARYWMRTSSALPDDPAVHSCVLAYMSDLTLLTAGLVPSDLHYQIGDVMQASLDHAMWFHRPFRADEWLLYDQVSPSASGARGLSIGRMFDRRGRLVATAVQEGLVRPVSAGRQSVNG